MDKARARIFRGFLAPVQSNYCYRTYHDEHDAPKSQTTKDVISLSLKFKLDRMRTLHLGFNNYESKLISSNLIKSGKLDEIRYQIMIIRNGVIVN